MCQKCQAQVAIPGGPKTSGCGEKMENHDIVQRIVVVGGGSAGWLAAARIAARNGGNSVDAVSITLIESANIPAVGVGEARGRPCATPWRASAYPRPTSS